MEEGEANTFFGQGLHCVGVSIERMRIVSIAVDDDGLDAVEGSGIFWPFVVDNGGGDTEVAFVQGVGEQSYACVVVVAVPTVAVFACEEEDVGRHCGDGKRKYCEEDGGGKALFFVHGFES